MTNDTLQRAGSGDLESRAAVRGDSIGVAVEDGVVVLSARVGSCVDRHTVEEMVRRVAGVRCALADLAAVYLSAEQHKDSDLEQRASGALALNVQAPSDKISVKAENGWVTLFGELEWRYQRDVAEADVRKLTGVVGLTNNIAIGLGGVPVNVRERVKAALTRNAQFEASEISVTIVGGEVTLSGRVANWEADNLAVVTAWFAPGVTNVVDHLRIG